MSLYPLSLLPQLFFLSPLAATILRIAAAFAFFYIAQRVRAMRGEIMAAQLPLVGHASGWMIWISSVVTFLTGLALLAGYYTQAVAILGALIALKHLGGTYWFPFIMPLSRGTYALLFIICISLIVTGAGAFALDMPL